MSSASSPKGAKRRGGLYNLDIFGDRSHTYHAFSSRLKHERWNYRNKGRADYPLPQNFHIGFVKMPCTGNILIVDIELWTPGDCCRWDVAVYWAVNFSLSGVIFRPFVYDFDWWARRAQAPVQSSLIRRLNAEYWILSPKRGLATTTTGSPSTRATLMNLMFFSSTRYVMWKFVSEERIVWRRNHSESRSPDGASQQWCRPIKNAGA